MQFQFALPDCSDGVMLTSSAFCSFQPWILPFSDTIHFSLPCLGSVRSASLMSFPIPARLPDFSAVAATCCLAGSAPEISACAASLASAPAFWGNTTATIRNPISARAATTNKVMRIFVSLIGQGAERAYHEL